MVKFKVIQNSLIFKLAHTFVLYLIDIKNKNIFSEMSMNVKQEVRYVVVDLGQPEHLFCIFKDILQGSFLSCSLHLASLSFFKANQNVSHFVVVGFQSEHFIVSLKMSCNEAS